MNDILQALGVALKNLFAGRMLGLVFKPLVGAVLFWGVATYFGWSYWLAMFHSLLDTGHVQDWLGATATGVIAGSLGFLLLAPLLVTVIFVTALMITALFSVPVMLEYLGPRDFPRLERKHGGTFTGSMVNATWALLFYLILVIITLPLWFILPFGSFWIPLLLSAYLNARMFRYDVLAEHATAAEYRELIRRDGGQMLLLGAVLALLQVASSVTLLLLPLVLLFGPVYSGLAFVHFGLARLQKLRQEQGTLPAPA